MKSDSVVVFMKETPMGRITVTSSVNEISTDQLGNRLMVKNVELLLGPLPPLSNYSYTGQIFKDDVYSSPPLIFASWSFSSQCNLSSKT
jgi:hypothetical protein